MITTITYRQNVGEDHDEGGVEVDGEGLGLGVEDVEHAVGVGAGVAELFVGQEEEGRGGAGGQEHDQRDQQLVQAVGAGTAVELELLAGLEEKAEHETFHSQRNGFQTPKLSDRTVAKCLSFAIIGVFSWESRKMGD